MIKDYINSLKYFVDLCDKEDIFYSLGDLSLLSSLSNSKHYQKRSYIEIFMSLDSFLKFKEKYPEFVIDYDNNKNIYLLFPIIKFDVDCSMPYIKVILFVKTSIKKLSKQKWWKNKINYHYGIFLKNKKIYSTRTFFIYLILFKAFWFIKYFPIQYVTIYYELEINEHEGFFMINNFDEKLFRNWFPQISCKVEKINFLGTKVKILKESKYYLRNKYGKKWKTDPKIKNIHLY